MIRGLYTAAAGMMTEQRKHDAITNNIANVNTPGYKRGETVARSFPEMLIHRIEASLPDRSFGSARLTSPVYVGPLNTGVYAEENISVFEQGDLRETNRPLDFAIVSRIEIEGVPFDDSGKYILPDGQILFQPQAFFTLRNDQDEVRFTRNGKFTLDESGQLVNAEGYRVVGTDGNPIILRHPATGNRLLEEEIRLDHQGRLITSGGQALGGLRLSRIENPYRLVAEGNGLFRLNPEDEALMQPLATSNEQVQIHQGYLEGSNVDAARVMIEMNVALRSYEANQKVIQYYDRSLEKAVNEVGRI